MRGTVVEAVVRNRGGGEGATPSGFPATSPGGWGPAAAPARRRRCARTRPSGIEARVDGARGDEAGRRRAGLPAALSHADVPTCRGASRVLGQAQRRAGSGVRPVTRKLPEYEAKRDFRVTPEPAPGAPPGRARSRLRRAQARTRRACNYDVRWRWTARLASWSVPKGPSYDPSIKRLAIQTVGPPDRVRQTSKGGFPTALTARATP